jgi:hypothetical protein
MIVESHRPQTQQQKDPLCELGVRLIKIPTNQPYRHGSDFSKTLKKQMHIATVLTVLTVGPFVVLSGLSAFSQPKPFGVVA